MLALVVAGLLLGGGDDGGGEADAPATTSTSRVRRPRPSTTTTVFVPTGPVFAEQTGALLVAARSGGAWTVVDLDTGARREVEVELDDSYAAVAVGDGVVGVRAGTAVYEPLRGDGDAVDLGRADAVQSAGRPDAVWLFVFSSEASEPSRLVDIEGRVLQQVDVPTSGFYGATRDGAVISGGGRVYVAEQGGVRSLSIGTVVATSDREVLVHECDDRARCQLVRIDTRTGARVPLPSIDADLATCCGYSARLASSGAVVFVSFLEDAVVVELVAPDGRSAGGRYESEEIGGNEPVVLPGGLGFLLPDVRGGYARVWAEDGAVRLETVPGLDDLRAERMFVLP